MDEDLKYKRFANCLYVILLIEVSIFAVYMFLLSRTSCDIYEQTKCSTKFNCSACNGGTQKCKTMIEYDNEIEEIICPCEDE